MSRFKLRVLGPSKRKSEIHLSDRLFFSLVFIFALGVFVFMGFLAHFLWKSGAPAFEKQGFSFLFHSNWDPVSDEFGALAFIFGTLSSSFLALLLATPLSIGVALFLTEVAVPRVSRWVGFLVQMLAAIPSVVYGLWGIFVLAPELRTTVQPYLAKTLGFLPLFQGPSYGVGLMAAGIILAIMITPTITSISVEVFRAIPQAQREAALALGATRWETMKIAVLKSSQAGIIGAVILGLGRALGETMAVTMVIGNRAEISWSLFAPGQTMASILANEYAEATSDAHLAALSAIGFSLFVVTLLVNAGANLLVWKLTRKTGQAS